MINLYNLYLHDLYLLTHYIINHINPIFLLFISLPHLITIINNR